MKYPVYLVLLTVLSAAPGFSQAAGRFAPGGRPGPGPGGFGPGGFGPGMFDRKVVTGAPYSATVTNQRVEQLADGNSIQQTITGQAARDSQGRMYEQETITGGPFAQNGPRVVTFITDPVAGFSYVLNADTKTATRRPFREHAQTRTLGASGAAPRQFGHRGNPPDATETDLGSAQFGSVSAQGKRLTRTIAAGAIGNAQPIVSNNEMWYSPDLQIVVKAVRSDPRTGTSTYMLSNIVSGKDPDPSLFQVPPGYAVTDATEPHGPHWGPRPPAQ